MTRFVTMRCLAAMVFAALLAGAPPAEAADSPVGTYLKKAEAGKPAMSMTIEQWAPGQGEAHVSHQGPAHRADDRLGAGRQRSAGADERKAVGRDDGDQDARQACIRPRS